MKRIIFLLLALAVSGLLIGCGQSNKGTFEQISAEEAIRRMDSESGYVIVDVRTPEEYSAGHIRQSINIPNESISHEKPSELTDLDQTIFVYCRSGNRSKQASKKLADMGYTHVVEFGGINQWPGEITSEETN